MVALDPKAIRASGQLEGKLGIKYNPAHLTDDQEFLPQRGTIVDRRFADHDAVLGARVDDGAVALGRQGPRPDRVRCARRRAVHRKGEQPKKTITIRSMESAFLDFNDNFTVRPGQAEKRQRWNIAAAIEGRSSRTDGKDKDGFRALVFADADLFADVLVPNAMGRRQS